MTIRLWNFWQAITRPGNRAAAQKKTDAPVSPKRMEIRSLDIEPNDPIVAYFQNSRSPIEVDKVNLNSPALKALKAADVKLAVPLVSQGELIGLLNLGPRLSEQEYSADDSGLLNNLATQAAPAVRVAQLVRQRQIEAQEFERVEQELRVAALIQQTLLPKQVPEISGWQLAVHYQPARAVGGDFYDFFMRPDGRIVIVVGDVTDKGVPAALLMATLRAILRGSMRRLLSPGAALERSNDLLAPEIPPNMFVTCLYAILDPATGRLQYANAGHDLPIQRSSGDVTELLATGMPLGLMPGMKYEEKEGMLAPGDSLLLYSDGLVEAHNPQREMFGFPRLRTLMAEHVDSSALIHFLLDQLSVFTGPNWEQEDDVTMVTLFRCESEDASSSSEKSDEREPVFQPPEGQSWQKLSEFSLRSEPGNEHDAMNRVSELVRDLAFSTTRLENLKTAVAEATMNAMEHGNHYQPELPVLIQVYKSESTLWIFITDQGGGRPIPAPNTPDLEAKLAGLQSPRGWGLFLIKNLVDKMHVLSDTRHHTIELVMSLQGGPHGSQPA
ncbi:MAG: SpoIIE family protein phosphatase [Acidobacteriota bacterium]